MPLIIESCAINSGENLFLIAYIHNVLFNKTVKYTLHYYFPEYCKFFEACMQISLYRIPIFKSFKIKLTNYLTLRLFFSIFV